jgi:hypothetical protein
VLATENQQQDSIKEPNEKPNEIPHHDIAIDNTKPIKAMESNAHSDAHPVQTIKEVKKQNALAKLEAKQEKIQIATKPVSEKNIKEKITFKDKIVEEAPDKPHLSPELLQQQIAQLGIAVREKQLSSSTQRIKFMDAINASNMLAPRSIYTIGK